MLVWRGEPGDLRHAFELATHATEASRTLLSQQVIALYAVARVQLARQQLVEALAAAGEAHRRLNDGPVEEWDEQIRLCYVYTLLSCGQEREANVALAAAFEALRQRIAAIVRPELRQSFMTRNDEVRQLLEMAHNRLGLTLD